tara:strand:+ start:99 stop:308 length:210 start_codon:yes stop_codon:yes gene_type:complete
MSDAITFDRLLSHTGLIRDGRIQWFDWSRPRWIFDELVMEEARRRERAGEGRVEDDGQPPARWVPKESE